jgi:hypothetical protein
LVDFLKQRPGFLGQKKASVWRRAILDQPLGRHHKLSPYPWGRVI